jgi:hypothetical protein
LRVGNVEVDHEIGCHGHQLPGMAAAGLPLMA